MTRGEGRPRRILLTRGSRGLPCLRGAHAEGRVGTATETETVRAVNLQGNSRLEDSATAATGRSHLATKGRTDSRLRTRTSREALTAPVERLAQEILVAQVVAREVLAGQVVALEVLAVQVVGQGILADLVARGAPIRGRTGNLPVQAPLTEI